MSNIGLPLVEVVTLLPLACPQCLGAGSLGAVEGPQITCASCEGINSVMPPGASLHFSVEAAPMPGFIYQFETSLLWPWRGKPKKAYPFSMIASVFGPKTLKLAMLSIVAKALRFRAASMYTHDAVIEYASIWVTSEVKVPEGWQLTPFVVGSPATLALARLDQPGLQEENR